VTTRYPSASARTTRAPGAPADIRALADRMDAAAGALEGRHEKHLARAARELRDARERNRYRGRQTGRTRPRGARMVGGRDAFRHGPGDPDEARNEVLYVRNVRDPERYRPDGARKALTDHREDYLDELRRADPARLDPQERAMLRKLDLAADLRVYAGSARRAAAVLEAPDDDWTVDPLDREVAKQVAADPIPADVVAVLEEMGVDIEPADEDPSVVRVIGYARVSTEEQGDNGASLEAQEHAIRQECERRGWRLVGMYQDIASGKTTARRPGLHAALERLETRGGARKPEAVVVSRLDRLTRSVADGGRLFERAKARGWGIVALDLGVDTTTPAGELVANVMVAVGQWERRVIAERTREALAQRKREGVRLGRPRATEQTARPEERARLERALPRLRELRAQGLSLRKIAAAMNEEGIPGVQGGRWHDRTVRLTLKRYGETPSPEELAAARR
jgi:DNA invertase Pin-like site-specific DNA recombinase